MKLSLVGADEERFVDLRDEAVERPTFFVWDEASISVQLYNYETNL